MDDELILGGTPLEGQLSDLRVRCLSIADGLDSASRDLEKAGRKLAGQRANLGALHNRLLQLPLASSASDNEPDERDNPL